MSRRNSADPLPMPWPLARIDSLGRPARIAMVVGGYLLAFGAAALASWAYNVRMAAMPYDTSGGMYAGGEMLTGLGAFFVAALPPTLLALWFLRRNARFWLFVAGGSLAFALVGLLGGFLFMSARAAPHDSLGIVLELTGLAQFLGVPLWTGAFVLFAILAPTRPARRLLLGAVAIELVIGVCAAIHLFSSRPS